MAVCVDRPLLSLDRPFTYTLPDDFDAGIGSLVQVPFHGRAARGWVLGPTDDVPPRTLSIRKVVSSVRYFDAQMLRLFRWMSDRYVAPLAAVIARSHPPRVASEEADLTPGSNGPDGDDVLSRPRGLIGRYRGGDALQRALAGGTGSFLLRPAPEDEQQLAVDAVLSTVASGKNAVLLVPEADPLPATAAAVLEAVGDAAGLFVGGDRRARYRAWLDISRGRFRVVVGTRPAVFAPLDRLGLVWVARESHPGHREERAPYYHVRDVALARARLAAAVCVTSAYCPSAEAAAMGAVTVEPRARAWPPVEVIRPGPGGRAPRLVVAVREATRAFLYEPLPGWGVARVCRSCGEPARCAACGGTLRQEAGAIRCVVCESPGRCAGCGSGDFGVTGTGAEQVADWAARAASVPVRRGPPAGPGLSVGGPESVKDVGPIGLDLVGILDADLAARRPGLSGMERALAVWMDAAAWARPSGRVMIQTARPNDPAVQSLVAGNAGRFHRAEAARRAAAGFPPGFPVFRVRGGPSLARELEALNPVALLRTRVGDETICLATVDPAGVVSFGRALRTLAEAGTVTRVEAEPHL